jgi:hypothetical protein
MGIKEGRRRWVQHIWGYAYGIHCQCALGPIWERGFVARIRVQKN